jgi:oligopeptide/dipeptide ABC transporter ATP-binding protein
MSLNTPEGNIVDPLLRVENLKTYFYTGDRVIPAVDGVSFDVYRGETLCIVGESGCGKSVTSMSIMRLNPSPPARYVDGRILLNGRDLLSFSKREMTDVRGKDISMIFQEPMTALNPVKTVGRQIAEVFIVHRNMSKSDAFLRAADMLALVGVPDPERCVKQYPHQLSGGMRQRVMIAMAFACKPKLLIADEPTTALDVTIQAQILDLIQQLKREQGMTVLFITHDLGVVAEIADRVIVMYAGRIAEQGTVKDVFDNPLHPYTKGLLQCIPRLDQRKEDLFVIEGQVPSPDQFPPGCRFHPRCPYALPICQTEMPELVSVSGHLAACHLKSGRPSQGDGEKSA